MRAFFAPSSSFVRTLCLLGLLFALIGQNAIAQPSGARGDDFIYRVIQNDTLIDLAERFTQQADNWSTLQDLNDVKDPMALPIGLQLRIPFDLIPERDAQGRVVHLRGQATANNTVLQEGDTVNEGDSIQTQDGSFLTLQFPDASESYIPGNSTVHIQRLQTFQGTGLVDVIFDLESGSLESSVAPEDTGTGRYEIRTPVSITGVRGTQLRVRNDADNGIFNEVLSGSAQLGSAAADGPKVAAGQGTAVTSSGRILPVQSLLPAPALASRIEQGQVDFEPVADANAYRVTIAADKKGVRPVSVQTITGPPAPVTYPGSGTWYLLVRAIDDSGLMGPDAILAFDGHPVLQSGSGLTVQTGYSQPVLLNPY